MSGGFHSGELDDLVDALVAQVSGPVRWIENMRALSEGGAQVIEVGPHRPLVRFFDEIGCPAQSIVNLRRGMVLGEPRA